jgi:O-antigen ligase
MGLVGLILVLAFIGFIMWAINKYVPMQSTIKTILNIAVVVLIFLWLLSLVGVLPDINAIRIGK